MYPKFDLTPEEAVLLDRLFRTGPQQTERTPAAHRLIEKDLARWADSVGTIEISELGRKSACVYRIP